MTESDVDKAILTCALTGVLTNPKQHPVPVTPAQMAAEARDAFTQAYKGMDERTEYRRLVEVKLNSLGVDPQPAEAAPAAGAGAKS